MKQSITEDDEEAVGLFFDHGIDVNMYFNNDPDGQSVLHFAAKNGSHNSILALVSRGAGLDPPDNSLRTPLMVAIESGKTKVARSLIELGADIELKD